MSASDDARQLAEQVAGEMTSEQRQAFLESVLVGGAGLFEDALRIPDPEVGDVPTRVRGFRGASISSGPSHRCGGGSRSPVASRWRDCTR